MYQDDTTCETIDIEMLVHKIGFMTELEHNYIFALVHMDTKKFTRNRNGVFVNMSVLSQDALKKIHQFVVFCENQRTDLCNNENKPFEKNF